MITHLISTWNTLDYLKISVNSLLKNSYFEDSKILIYNEGSTDGTGKWLNSLDNNRITHWNKSHEWNKDFHGIGGGINFLVEKCDTDIFNLIHTDFYVTKHFDKSLYNKLQYEGKDHFVSSYRCEPDLFNQKQSKYGTVIVPKNTFGEYYDNFNEQKFENWSKKFTEDNNGVDIPLLQGVSYMMYKDSWLDVGYNDPIFAPASVEDVDWSIRARKKGYKFHTIGSSMVYHFGARSSHFIGDNLSQSSQRQQESERKNNKLFKEKWGEEFIKDKWGQFILPSMVD